ALGVEICLGEIHLGLLRIQNTESRRRELAATIESLIANGGAHAKELECLRGRLQFAETQIFGRGAVQRMRVISRAMKRVGFVVFDDTMLEALLFLKDRVLHGPPRVLRACDRPTYHLFTDASYERDQPAGLGGILYSDGGLLLRWFSERAEPDLLNNVKSEGKKGLIYELEACAAVQGLLQLCESLNDCDIICYCDNDAALAALIKCASDATVVAAQLSKLSFRSVHGPSARGPDGVPLVLMSSAAPESDGGEDVAGSAEGPDRDKASAAAASSGESQLVPDQGLIPSGASGEIDLTSWSLPEGGAGSVDGRTNRPDSEDLPLSELFVSEARWWNQVRDVDTGTSQDPLAGRTVNFQAAFRSACQQQVPSTMLDLIPQPWDEGVFGVILGDKDFFVFPAKRACQVFLPGEESREPGTSEAAVKRIRHADRDLSFSKVVRARAVVDWRQQRTAQLEIGLKQARAISILQDFLKDRGSTFPCTESDLYDFLKVMEKEGAPASRIASIMEAVNFTRHVVGVSELAGACLSRRCKGICTRENFVEPKQAPALTVEQLLMLHSALEEHRDPWTRAFATACLTCAYCRCRWSDVQHTESILWDLDLEGNLFYIELSIGVHKTCRLQSKRHKFLHAVSPALGLRPYGQLWRECREQLGIEHHGRCVFMPAPDQAGRPTVRALDTDEATAWLRLILGLSDAGTQVSSKSLKATVISWAAKRGVDPLTLQRLGYHAAGGMDLVYSRDAQAPLLIVVERLLKEVRDGVFRPDDTRSGRLVTSGAQPLGVNLVPPLSADVSAPAAAPTGSDVVDCKTSEAQGPALTVDSDSDLSEALGESSEESDEDFGQPIAVVAQGQVVPAGFDVWRHSTSQVAHLAPQMHFKNLFACGRAVSERESGKEWVRVVLNSLRPIPSRPGAVVFTARCSEISADGSVHAALVAQGLKSFRQLAFAIGTPRVEPTAEQYTYLASQVFGANPAIGKIALLRDVHFEATTYVIQAFKEQATSDGTEAQVKRLPMPERTARAADQQRRLSGIAITGELQPSFQLVDKCNTMLETGALIWLPPSVCSKRRMRVISRAMKRVGFVVFDDAMMEALLFLKDRVLHGPPRVLRAGDRPTYHLFTDASYERDQPAGLGGILYSDGGLLLRWLSERAEPDLLNNVNVEGKKGLIYELEACAAVQGLLQLCESLDDCDIICYCDNDAALAALIKCASDATIVAAQLSKLSSFEDAKSISLWFERVESAANPADAPSRFELDGLPKSFRVRWDPVEELLF
ncbi:unnamed protein product, partial [Symbiodinium sp. CCMP2456]